MNDRVSRRPPSLYTREEEVMAQYVRNQGQPHADLDMDYDAGIESHKPSGVFRFGKAIANAFKPFTVWPGAWKDKEKERSTSPEKNVLQERQAKAIEAYAELKKNGFKGTQTYSHHETQVAPKINLADIENQQTPHFRDSGIDMDDCRLPYEPNPNDQLIGITEALLVPPPPKKRSISPFSDVSSARKPSLNFRKPSLQGLKKVTSQIHLSPVKRQSDTPTVPSIETEHVPESTTTAGPSLQRQPSRKDIAKHTRLSKKVSDLENKLETARRELELSISNAPPVPDLPSRIGRKPFMPGALPSLPSERNMSPQKDRSTQPISNDENPSLENDRSAGRIAYDAETFKQGTNIQDVLNLETAKAKNRVRKASKAHETKAQTPTGVKKPLPRIPSRTPRNSPLRPDENVPPVPSVAAASIVDPMKNPQPNAQSKVTDHTSVSHLDRVPSPFLGPPATASPMRTRSKASRRGISPPPPSLASAKKVKNGSEDAADTPTKIAAIPPGVDVDPVTSDAPRKSFDKTVMAGASLESCKESFEWDDDVF